jgi:hypothetical protein
LATTSLASNLRRACKKHLVLSRRLRSLGTDGSSLPSTRLLGLSEAAWLVLIVVLPSALNPAGALGVEPVKASLAYVLTALVVGAWVAGCFCGAAPRPAVRSQPVVLAGLVLAATATVSTLFSLDRTTSFFGTDEREMGLLTTWAGAALLLCGAGLLANTRFRERTVSALLLAAVVPCVYALAQSFGWDPIQWAGVIGIVSTFGSPTFLGAFLVFVFPFALYRLATSAGAVVGGSRRSAEARYVGYLCVSVLVVAVVLRVAIRGPVLGMLAGTGVFAALVLQGRHPPRSSWRLGATLALLALVAIGLAAPAWLPTARRFVEATDPRTHAAKSIDERLGLWRAVAPLPLRDAGRAIVGFGPEMQPAIFEQAESIVGLSPAEEFDRAHNLVLDTWITGGLLGVIGLVAATGIALRAAVRRSRQDSFSVVIQTRERVLAAAVAAALIGHLVEQMFAFETVTSSALFWVALALAASLSATVEPTSLRVARARRPLRWAAIPVVLGLVAVPVLVSPAVADGLRGAALVADLADDRVAAASLAQAADAWTPWSATPAAQAGFELEALAAAGGAAGSHADFTGAEREFVEAASRAAWDPFAQLALVQLYLDWSRQPAEADPPGDVLDRAERACGRALEAGPYRRDVWRTCAEVSASRGEVAQAAARGARVGELPDPPAASASGRSTDSAGGLG